VLCCYCTHARHARRSDSAITGSAIVNRHGAPIPKDSSEENAEDEGPSEDDVSDSSRRVHVAAHASRAGAMVLCCLFRCHVTVMSSDHHSGSSVHSRQGDDVEEGRYGSICS
jgi:hypothetical protein